MPLSDLQKKTAHAIVNIFETGKVLGDYSAVTLIPGDKGRLTYGRSQVTLGSGGLHKLLQEYCARGDAQMAEQFQPLLPRFLAKDQTLDKDESVKALLRAAGEDLVMRGVQDAFFEEGYWVPACRAAAKHGLTTALSTAVVYDSHIHGGSTKRLKLKWTRKERWLKGDRRRNGLLVTSLRAEHGCSCSNHHFPAPSIGWTNLRAC